MSTTGPVIRLDFADFWPTFDKRDNFFFNLLSQHYRIEITPHPDFLIYSVFGSAHMRYRCTRIQYIAENVRPDFSECDYAFSFDHLDDTRRHFRLPLYVLYADLHGGIESLLMENALVRRACYPKTRFCNMVVSNASAPERIEAFNRLSTYKPVDSGGRYLNNIGAPVKDKLEFISHYKFTIAFENASCPGYTTEKILHPMLMGSIPIYWGDPLVERDFNTRSFINCHEYGSLEDAIERVLEIDSDEALYEQYLSEPYFHDDRINAYAAKDRILGQFERIFSNPVRRVATTMDFKRRVWRWNARRGIARIKSMLRPRGSS
jgi:hypothetical protein